MKQRRTEKSRAYTKLMNYQCAYPHCKSGKSAEGHHVVPLSKGGADKFWNMISLCRDCHRQYRLHSKWSEVKTSLYAWKSLQELEHLGFTLDENDEDFYDNCRDALLMSNENEKELKEDHQGNKSLSSVS